MRRALSSCRLYSWMRLIWQSKMVSGSTVWPDVVLSQSANCTLASRLALRKALRKPVSSASGLSLLSWPRSVIQPSPMASVIVRASAGFASSSQRRGVTPLVLLLKRSGNISAKSLTVVVRSSSEWIAATPLVLCEPTMARFAMRTCLRRAFLDQAHARDAALVAGEADPDGIEQAAVDLVDDLQVARQQHLEPRDRPFLQGFGQQGVVRVGQSPLREVPGLVPAEVRLVQQNAHQLGHGHAWGACR